MHPLKTDKKGIAAGVFSIYALIIFLVISQSSCIGDFDLPRVDFPEVITLDTLEVGLPTDMVLFGEIRGLKEKSTVEEHGHVWKSWSAAGTTGLDLDHYDGRRQKQRMANGIDTSHITGLKPDSLYAYRAYAVHKGKPYYGAIRYFFAGSLGPQLTVDSTVVIPPKASTGSNVQVYGCISGLPQGMQIFDYGIVLVHLSSPGDNAIPSLEPGNGEVYSLGTIPHADQVNPFSVPVNQLLPGYYRLKSYFQVNGITFYSDPSIFSIGDFWERREDVPSYQSKFPVDGISAVLNGKAYISFYSAFNPTDDIVITCDNHPQFWSYDPQESWTPLEVSPLLFEKNGVAFPLGNTIYFCLGASYNPGGGYYYLNSQTYGFTPGDENLSLVSDGCNLELGPNGIVVSCPERMYGISFTLGGKGYAGLGYGNHFDQGDTTFHEKWNSDFYVFDPSGSPQWKEIDPFPGEPLKGAVAFTLGDKAYVGLGKKENGELNYDFWIFDGANWIGKTAPFPGQGRVNASSFSIYDKGYVGWGTSNATFDISDCESLLSDPLVDVWEFDPSSGTNGTWTQKASFAGVPRQNVVVFTLGNAVYAGLGEKFGASYTPPFTDFYQYYPD